MDQVAVILTSLNEKKIRNLELSATAPDLTIGRAVDNHVVISDQRCSSKHCILSLGLNADGDPEVTVEDQSSNGTYTNGRRVGLMQIAKNTKTILKDGDVLAILKGPLIPESDSIEFKVKITRKRRLDEPEAPPSKKPKLTSDLSEDLCCGICTGVIHQCVTLMPCLHNVNLHPVLRRLLLRLASKVQTLSSL